MKKNILFIFVVLSISSCSLVFDIFLEGFKAGKLELTVNNVSVGNCKEYSESFNQFRLFSGRLTFARIYFLRNFEI